MYSNRPCLNYGQKVCQNVCYGCNQIDLVVWEKKRVVDLEDAFGSGFVKLE